MSSNFDWVTGVKVKITTLLDDIITGHVYTYDTSSNSVALIVQPKGYRLVKTSFIREVQVLEKAADSVKNSLKPGYVSIEGMAKREAAAVSKTVRLRSTKGVGVSTDAQTIFDAVYKTLPSRWHGKSIIVVDEVRIDPPYTADSCIADDPKSSALTLVKRIITGVREKLKMEVKGG